MGWYHCSLSYYSRKCERCMRFCCNMIFHLFERRDITSHFILWIPGHMFHLLWCNDLPPRMRAFSEPMCASVSRIWWWQRDGLGCLSGICNYRWKFERWTLYDTAMRSGSNILFLSRDMSSMQMNTLNIHFVRCNLTLMSLITDITNISNASAR